jgi:hypothetical protein
MPRENILSKTEKQSADVIHMKEHNSRVAVKALAVVWHARCVRASGGLTPSKFLK